MSYAVRNTIILLVALTLMMGGAWSYLHFFQGQEIEELETELSEKQDELTEQEQIASQLPELEELYDTALDYYNNYEKGFYPDDRVSDIFDYLNRINASDAFTDFTFAFNDSTVHEQHGVVRTEIQGEGYYRNFLNLIRKLELSRPLNKVQNISITPRNSLEEYGIVDYSFVLESYYYRGQDREGQETNMNITNNVVTTLYNPFFPLIREVAPNEDNLVNIENSRLLAVSNQSVFILDHEGSMQRLSVGDDVYLGELRSVSLNERSATFELNKGGIVEIVTLEAQQ